MATDTQINSDGGPSNRRRKLSDIKSKLLRPSLTSQYICKFDFPGPVRSWTRAKGTPYDREETDLLSVSCSEAALPGSSLMTHELNNAYTGVTEKHAYRRAYDQVASFTFMVDHDHTAIKLFENWMSYIVGEQFATSPNIKDPNYFYRVRYPELYTTDMGNGGALYISKFEKDYADTESKKSLQYQFIKSFPLSIVTMPVSYEASQLLKCTVNFTYSRYTITQENLSGTVNVGKEDTSSSFPFTSDPDRLGLNDLSTSITSTSPIA